MRHTVVLEWILASCYCILWFITVLNGLTVLLYQSSSLTCYSSWHCFANVFSQILCILFAFYTYASWYIFNVEPCIIHVCSFAPLLSIEFSHYLNAIYDICLLNAMHIHFALVQGSLSHYLCDTLSSYISFNFECCSH